ncbi:hypothetical protein ACO2I3_14460 [Leptospira interrogans]
MLEHWLKPKYSDGPTASRHVGGNIRREALDPDQPNGSPIALPDDPVLLGDLTAPTSDILPRGILIESKDDVKARIGRSPDRGDAVVMAWSQGQSALRAQAQLRDYGVQQERPKFANVGYASQKRFRNRQ